MAVAPKISGTMNKLRTALIIPRLTNIPVLLADGNDGPDWGKDD